MESQAAAKKPTVVLFPGLGMGHLTPMAELAKLFIAHKFSVTILVLDDPFDLSSARPTFISGVSSAYPSISFHRLPKITAPPRPRNSQPLLSALDILRLTTPHISTFLSSLISQTAVDIRAFVLDFLCTDTLDVAAGLGIPSLLFFPTSASNLAAFLSVPKLQSETTTTSSFRDMGDEAIQIPGLPPMPASHMARPLLDRNEELYSAFVHHLERLTMADKILINTFDLFEERAVQALVEGLCVLEAAGRRMPPVYCVGPLVADNGGGGEEEEEERHECLKWLDAQPKESVVFLCFGSMGLFSSGQLKEIAIGLERSGQRFLWAVRSPPPCDDPRRRFEPRPEADLSVLMPEGFIERTEGRGMVVKSWAPQAAVLEHESVGGFVSHCGWNSTLEAVRAGVPMVAWPLYAEQKMNKVFLVEEVKLAVEMKGYDKEMVSAQEVETKVRWLMESEGGRGLKDRAASMKESAMAAKKEEGSSGKAWMQLVDVLSKTGH